MQSSNLNKIKTKEQATHHAFVLIDINFRNLIIKVLDDTGFRSIGCSCSCFFWGVGLRGLGIGL